MKTSKQQKQEAIDRLRDLLPPGSTVHTVLRHVSRSGMSRAIDCYLLKDSDRVWLSALIARATGITFDDKRECLKVGGCGMGMGFSIVYDLARVLYPDGFDCVGDRQTAHRQHTAETCPGAKYHADHPACDHVESWTSRRECPSNDHSNGDRNYAPHRHTGDGGYALRHEWL